MNIQPYLFFNGRCEEAIAFYCSALGAEATLKLRFRDAPPDPTRPPAPPELADKIMHATLTLGSTQLLLSDGGCITKNDAFNGFGISLTGDDPATAQRYFDALAQGGQITMPFQKTFWSSGFGMLTDRFGIPWMVSGPMTEHAGQA